MLSGTITAQRLAGAIQEVLIRVTLIPLSAASAGTSSAVALIKRLRRILAASAGTSTSALAPTKRQALTIESGAILGPDNEPILYSGN